LKLKDWLRIIWGLACPIAGLYYFGIPGLIVSSIFFIIYAWIIYTNTKPEEEIKKTEERTARKINSFTEKVDRMTKAIEADTKRRKFYKNSKIATISSFFFMGLGQLYNGQIAKGLIFITLYFISIALITVGIGLFTTPVLWLWGMVDANKTAKNINKQTEMAMNDNFHNHSKNIEI
jgi:TM2 domain-containing membrane protein YozV